MLILSTVVSVPMASARGRRMSDNATELIGLAIFMIGLPLAVGTAILMVIWAICKWDK